jgi:hypothetical protein
MGFVFKTYPGDPNFLQELFDMKGPKIAGAIKGKGASAVKEDKMEKPMPAKKGKKKK